MLRHLRYRLQHFDWLLMVLAMEEVDHNTKDEEKQLHGDHVTDKHWLEVRSQTVAVYNGSDSIVRYSCTTNNINIVNSRNINISFGCVQLVR